MRTVLSSNQKEILGHFYNKLFHTIISSKTKIDNKSLILTIIKLNANQVSKFIIDSGIQEDQFLTNDIHELSKMKLIRKLDEFEIPIKYVITTFGLWYIEEERNIIDITRLLNYFQEVKMSLLVSDKPLKSVEKVILLSMISARNFAADASMNTNDVVIRDNWLDIFNLSARFLYSVKTINKKEWITSNQGHEHPVTYVMRRANDLPQKTKHIYKTLGNNRYYLDIDNKQEDPQKKLLFLLSIIFNKKEIQDIREDLFKFLRNLSYDMGIKVRNNILYINPEWDRIVEKTIDELYYQ